MFPQKGIFDFSLNLSYILYNNTQVFKKKTSGICLQVQLGLRAISLR